METQVVIVKPRAFTEGEDPPGMRTIKAMDEPAAEEHVKRLGRANLPRMPAVNAFKSEVDLGQDNQPAPFNADLPKPELASDDVPAGLNPGLPKPDLVGPEEDNLPAPFAAALEVVRTAKDSLERMSARCREVEAFTKQETDYHRAQLATADTVIVELDNKRTAHEASLQQLQAQRDANIREREGLQRSLGEMRSAYEHSQELLRAAEKRATAAETWLGRLHAELTSAFSELR